MPIFEADHLRKAFIGGRWAEPVNGGVEHDIINPATGEVSGALLFSDEADVNLPRRRRATRSRHSRIRRSSSGSRCSSA